MWNSIPSEIRENKFLYHAFKRKLLLTFSKVQPFVYNVLVSVQPSIDTIVFLLFENNHLYNLVYTTVMFLCFCNFLVTRPLRESSSVDWVNVGKVFLFLSICVEPVVDIYDDIVSFGPLLTSV